MPPHSQTLPHPSSSCTPTCTGCIHPRLMLQAVMAGRRCCLRPAQCAALPSLPGAPVECPQRQAGHSAARPFQSRAARFKNMAWRAAQRQQQQLQLQNTWAHRPGRRRRARQRPAPQPGWQQRGQPCFLVVLLIPAARQHAQAAGSAGCSLDATQPPLPAGSGRPAGRHLPRRPTARCRCPGHLQAMLAGPARPAGPAVPSAGSLSAAAGMPAPQRRTTGGAWGEGASFFGGTSPFSVF